MKLSLGYILCSIITCTIGTAVRRSSQRILDQGIPAIPVKQNGSVTWDGYTLLINDQRIFLWSGEFHPWRLPVVHKWRDILEKVKAAGMNAISVYVHWYAPYSRRRVALLTNGSSRGLTNPAPGIFDFDDYRALDPLFKMAMEIGIWIVLRPGPYINAETTGREIPCKSRGHS